jgi:hypothetical protein
MISEATLTDLNIVKEKIIETATQGEFSRGSNGAVMLDQDSKDVVYLLTNEFQPREFQEKLEDMLSEDGREYFYIVIKNEKEMHITKIKK